MEDMMVQWQTPPEAPIQSNGVSQNESKPIEPIEAGDIIPENNPYFPYQWNIQAMGALDTWAAGCTGAGVQIAITDGGIDPNHPDLAPTWTLLAPNHSSQAKLSTLTLAISGMACTWPCTDTCQTMHARA
jgi:hypothetical protein